VFGPVAVPVVSGPCVVASVVLPLLVGPSGAVVGGHSVSWSHGVAVVALSLVVGPAALPESLAPLLSPVGATRS
jgi:hypothetical protein